MSRTSKVLKIVFPILIAALLISDFATSMVFKLSLSSFYRYSGMFKLAVEIVMFISIITTFKSPQLIHKVLFAIIGCFIIGQLTSSFIAYDLLYHFSTGNVYYLNRYLYIFLFIIFLNTYSIEKDTYRKAYSFFEALLLINCVIILIGIIFQIDIFKSYEYTERFGYVGLFSKPEEAAYLYCIAIILNYYNWVNTARFKHIFKVILFSVTILFFGQKKMLLFFALFTIMYLVYENRYKIYFRYFIPITIFIAFLFRSFIFKFLLERMPFWKQVHDGNGILAVITSYRNVLLKKTITYINAKWDTINYVFGSLNFGKFKVEFEVVDLFFFLGISGLFLYYYILKYHFFNTNDHLKNRLLFIIFVTSFFSGGLLLSVSATLVLYFVSNKIMTKTYG